MNRIGKHFPVKFFLIVLIAQLQLFQFSHCQFYNSQCGTLYAETYFGGQNISFSDGDQATNIHEGLRSATGSWSETKSIIIKNLCSMEICNEAYFEGSCLTLSAGSYPTMEMNMTDLSDIASVSCNCEKECKCEDVFMKKRSCARAYLEGGCSMCNSPYIKMRNTNPSPIPGWNNLRDFPSEYRDRVTVLKLRKGCTLTLYPPKKSDQAEILIDREIFDMTKRPKVKIERYRCSCDDNKYGTGAKPPRDESYPPFVEIPGTMDEIIKIMMDKKYTNHSGLRAAQQSLKNKRSPKNAYILLLGSAGSGKSSTINLLFDNPNLVRVNGWEFWTADINEYRSPVAIDEYGVANSELHVIDTPELGDTRGTYYDAMFLTTLEDYLASHEELKDKIPNVVMVFHKFNDDRFDEDGAHFVQMLRALEKFRNRITDDNFSNVIFVLSHFLSETKLTQRNPKNRIAQFKRTIEKFSSFPKPIIISVAENSLDEQDLPMVNGYAQLPNREYYPRNLFDKMDIVTSKGGDPIGQGAFRTAFRNSDDFNISTLTYKLFQTPNDRVAYYLQVLTDAQIKVKNTDISQVLKCFWEDKVDEDLKENFPKSLSYLQKVLNLKMINSLDDVPQTDSEVLDLLSAIKHDEGTSVLLEKGLRIKPPVFPTNTIVGQSYDVFKDSHLTNSPFAMGELKQSDIGFLLPDGISVKLESGAGEHFHLFNTEQEYIQFRLKSLGLDGISSEQNFTGIIKPGHNIKSISFRNDSCFLNAMKEVKLFEFMMNDKATLTSDFKNRVRALGSFNRSDYESVIMWKQFFNDYGTHVVSSIYGGGAIQIKLKSDKPYDPKLSKTILDVVRFAEEMSFMIIHDGGSNDSRRGVIDSGVVHKLRFTGGDPAYYTTDLTQMSVEAAAKLLSNWKKSLKYQPIILTTEMGLVPLSQIVKELGENYSLEMERATSLLLKSKFKFVPACGSPAVVDSRDRRWDFISKRMELLDSKTQYLIEGMQKLESEMKTRGQGYEKHR